MKTFTKLSFLLLALLTFSNAWADKPVRITVDWEDKSYENKVEVYDQANNLILTICNKNIPGNCYNGSGSGNIYTATYDLGCLQNGTYKVRLYQVDDNAWESPAYIKVFVNNVEVINNDGSNASDTGFDIPFTISNAGGNGACSPGNAPDSDGDGVIDRVDLDDDNDGIPDADEGLGINAFDCAIPALNFAGNNNTAESGTAGQVGAIYRFANAIFGEPYDVLVEITEIRNTTLINIDDDSVDNANYLQTRLEFTGNETPADCIGCDYPGITFKFTIVDVGTSTPATTLFRIGGTTWDVDGGPTRRESVRYYDPSAYGTDNPTTVQVTDVNGDASQIEMTAGGILEGPGFSTLQQLRSYFQFKLNAPILPKDHFILRMQNVRTTYTATNAREYGMSFTQCNVLDFESASIIIVDGQNSDGDIYDNQVDIDSDDDGIPDNVEAQLTTNYILPNYLYDPLTGVDTAYDPNHVDPISGLPDPGTPLVYVDTDGDLIYDFLDTDSDNDGKPDITENGLVNMITPLLDLDNDGLNDDFETNGTEANNSLFDVNEDIENPLDLTILPDTDGDLALFPLEGDLDYRDAIDTYFTSASIDFDGVDDYLSTNEFLMGSQEATMMAWVKIDVSNTGATTSKYIISNNGGFDLNLANGNFINLIIGTGSGFSTTGGSNISYGEWHHIAASFSGITGEINLFVDGQTPGPSVFDVTGEVLSPSFSGNGNFEVGRRAVNNPVDSYFPGEIDEVRIFNKALTTDQIQRIVYQEIENNAGNLKGTSINKDIVDISTSATVPWNNLQAYYPLSDIVSSRTLDFSSNSRDLLLNNITSTQLQTAPMPYETVADGLWTTEGTWLHGDVWDIEDVANNKDWSIVHIHDNVSTTRSHSQMGMFIDATKTLTSTGDNEINNSWYLQLDGTLNLEDDSQLVQGINSDLVTSSLGKIKRRQEGNGNAYWYNYWSSPVGTPAVTTLNNNNDATDNLLNITPFSLDMLKDGNEAAIEFTNAYQETGKVSTDWLYTFQNGLTYYNWVPITPTTAIAPGTGYTQKGTGNGGSEQQYIFEGKPNNGTILLAADDVPDSAEVVVGESAQDVTLTTTLIGNPYPSALDAKQFINDNITVINGNPPPIQGTILLWEQWAGNSHYLAEYEGGYGFINLLTTERAYQHADIPIASQSQTQGIKRPTFYIPVGQSFFVEVITDTGNIEFNNGQRVFIKESDVLIDQTDPNYADGGSMFFRNSNAAAQTGNQGRTASTADSEENPMQLIRFEFGTSQGSTRRFVLGFSDTTTDGFDYGYDGGIISNAPADDMGSIFNDTQYVLQALSPITPEKEVDLTLNASGDYTYSLKIVELQNIDEDQVIYLRDNFTNTYHDLRSEQDYNFTSESGTFTDRFDVVFQTPDTLSNNEFDADSIQIYVNNPEDKLFVKGLTTDVKSLNITNMLGQSIATYNNIERQTLENGINVSNLSSGVYMVTINTDQNLTTSKKVIIE